MDDRLQIYGTEVWDHERMNRIAARPEPICTCGHPQYQHDDTGCLVYLDGGRSVCPCTKYTASSPT